MVKITIGKTEATIQDWVWTCEDEILRDLLTVMLPWGGPSGSDPYPDLTVASSIARSLGGKVVSYDPPPPVDPNVIY